MMNRVTVFLFMFVDVSRVCTGNACSRVIGTITHANSWEQTLPIQSRTTK